jgi:hypothetical protein
MPIELFSNKHLYSTLVFQKTRICNYNQYVVYVVFECVFEYAANKIKLCWNLKYVFFIFYYNGQY